MSSRIALFTISLSDHPSLNTNNLFTRPTPNQTITMQTKYIALALASVAAAVAAPADQMANNGYVEISREPAKLSEGTLIWYGPENATEEKRDNLEARYSCTTQGTAPVW